MYIVEITPLVKSIKKESLSYFSSANISVGSIVTVPLRNRTVKGLVIGLKEIEDKKTEIRALDYSLKKITGVSKNTIFSSGFISAAEKTSNFFATSTGSILNAMIPSSLSDSLDKLEKKIIDKEKKESSGRKYIIQTEDEDRYSEYKSIIRQQFAKEKTTIFCVPTVEEANYAMEKLTRGIQTHTFILHSQKTKKEVLSTWNEITKYKRACLVICTPIFVGVPAYNPGLFIIERDSSSAYRTRQRPLFDMRFFIEEYANASGADLIIGDLMLRSETLLRYDEHELFEHTPIKFRSISDARGQIIDTQKKDKSISNTLSKILVDNFENDQRSFLLVPRKGLAPLVVCGDCGEIVRCTKCNAPVVLYGKDASKKDNFFRCHSCGEERSAGEICINCGSWKLKSVGFGVMGVKKEVEKMITEAKIFVLDKDNAPTAQKARDIVQKFYDSPCGILIGTEMALLYIREKIEAVSVVSLDSMFSLPDFRVRERVTNILLRARALASQDFIIQTKQKDNEVFKNVIEGNLSDFYRKEFVDRKKFNYPPFALLIKISVAGKTFESAEQKLNDVSKRFKDYPLQIYPSFQSIRGNKVLHGMIRLPRKQWPDSQLIDILRDLPPYFRIEIDTESVL